MKEHNFEKADRECIWRLKGLSCDGEVVSAIIFNGQITVPVCKNHLDDHRIIISLKSSGYNINVVIKMSPEERAKLAAGITLVDWDKI